MTVTSATLWQSLRRTLCLAPDGRPAIALQPVGLSAIDRRAMKPLLDEVGLQLALRFELRDAAAEIVLLDADYAGATPLRQVQELAKGRPVVLVVGSADKRQGAVADGFERCCEELLIQLKQITLVRSQSALWGAGGWRMDGATQVPATTLPPSAFVSAFDADFDSQLDGHALAADPLDEPRRDLVERVLNGMQDRATPPLAASYGPGACLRFNFAARSVAIDLEAQRCLRVLGELPAPAAGARPLAGALVCDLDETVWGLGLASGGFALLDAPEDWWHTPLLGPAASQIARYSRLPRHLELARQLVAGPASPSTLRKCVRVGIPELRQFLQACLFLGLVHWDRGAAR
jgi:hypothetical protein